MKYTIGIDLGTSAVKLILMDETGEIVRTVRKSYPLSSPKPGWSEQAPQDWWNAVCASLESLLQGVDASSVKGVGVGGQMHGLVLLDENDRVLRPAILWNDTRTGEETAFLNEEIGKARLQALTGNIAFAGFTAPKLLWVRKHEPEVFAKMKKICLPKDYINYKLTGVFATDVSDASGTLYFDVEHRCWSREMLSILGIEERMLPQIFESSDTIGTTDLFGLNAAVVAGAGDNAAAAIGTDTVNGGQCNISLGTSGTVFLPTEGYVKTENPALHSFCHANGKWHLMGCILSAASCNGWLNETVFESKYDVGTGNADGLFFLPYLSGERCPHNDESVRGAFLGLTHTTSREDLQLALYEGVAFAIRDCIALCPQPVKSATVCGGGTKSVAWMQVLADVLGIELHVIENEGPAYGGALLAAGLRHAPMIQSVVTPNAQRIKSYQNKYEHYKALYPILKDFFKEEQR